MRHVLAVLLLSITVMATACNSDFDCLSGQVCTEGVNDRGVCMQQSAANADNVKKRFKPNHHNLCNTDSDCKADDVCVEGPNGGICVNESATVNSKVQKRFEPSN